MKINTKGKAPFRCRDFENNIKTFLQGELPDSMYDRFIDHYNSCSECNEELEILFLVNYALNDEHLDRGSLNLKELLDSHMEEMKEQVYWRYKYRFIKNSFIGLAQFISAVAFTGYTLHLLGIL